MKKQYYGIKFPFSEESDDLTFFDLNQTKEESIRSQLIHLILTPKGQRLRNPEFGTDLIKYVFEVNDDITWENLKKEIREQVFKYVPQANIDDLKVIHNTEEKNSIYLEIDYSLIDNGQKIINKTLIKL